ncbi:hypothetical protein FNF29_05360 [Cafeteria roenbergensis]|uniref:Uncharacterized protein n=1 Tax=Cafeteria roenbergensis TaxID=33653 RepID=A0A5A8CBW3_CAFRO|nr:hypothetical protein FNF29_05360 [Cafeteria roenbergensis]|eukprot:KAA0150348.1 hypothetical protein FNF29_05360 [Cafeteria roenbergensis]
MDDSSSCSSGDSEVLEVEDFLSAENPAPAAPQSEPPSSPSGPAPGSTGQPRDYGDASSDGDSSDLSEAGELEDYMDAPCEAPGHGTGGSSNFSSIGSKGGTGDDDAPGLGGRSDRSSGSIAGASASVRSASVVEQLDWFAVMQNAFTDASLSVEQTELFVAAMNAHDYEDGDYIVRQGDVGDAFFIIESGCVSVEEAPKGAKGRSGSGHGAAGDAGSSGSGASAASGAGIEEPEEPPRVLAKLYPGHHFGELSVLNRQNRVASVVARGGPVRCRVMCKRDFDAFAPPDRTAFTGVIESLVAETKRKRTNRSLVKASDRTAQLRFVEQQRRDFKVVSTMHERRTGERQQMINEFLVLRKLGQGSFGTVKLAKNTETNEVVALKVINKSKLRKRRLGITDEELMREVDVMRRLRNEHVVAMREAINDESHDLLIFVEEYMAMGPVMEEAEACDPLDEALSRVYFRSVLRGLEYLHFQRVVHRDIKPANILVSDSGEAKLADFGVAAVLPEGATSLRDVQGTPAFMAPELFGDIEEYDGFAVDIWALGATLFNLVTGRPPFLASSQMELAEKLRTEAPEYPRGMNPHLRHLIGSMLERDVSKRASLSTIMRHDWVTIEGTDPMPPIRYVRVKRADAAPALRGLRVQSVTVAVSGPASPAGEAGSPAGGAGARGGSRRRLPRRVRRSSLTGMSAEDAAAAAAAVAAADAGHARTASPATPGAPHTSGERRGLGAGPAAVAKARGIPGIATGGTSLSRRASVPVMDSPRSSTGNLKPGTPSDSAAVLLSSPGTPETKPPPAPVASGGPLPDAPTRTRSSTSLKAMRSSRSGILARQREIESAARKAHLQQLRRRQVQLLRGHKGLSGADRDLMMEQQRIPIHASRAEIAFESIEIFSGGDGSRATPPSANKDGDRPFPGSAGSSPAGPAAAAGAAPPASSSSLTPPEPEAVNPLGLALRFMFGRQASSSSVADVTAPDSDGGLSDELERHSFSRPSSANSRRLPADARPEGAVSARFPAPSPEPSLGPRGEISPDLGRALYGVYSPGMLRSLSRRSSLRVASGGMSSPAAACSPLMQRKASRVAAAFVSHAFALAPPPPPSASAASESSMESDADLTHHRISSPAGAADPAASSPAPVSAAAAEQSAAASGPLSLVLTDEHERVSGSRRIRRRSEGMPPLPAAVVAVLAEGSPEAAAAASMGSVTPGIAAYASAPVPAAGGDALSGVDASAPDGSPPAPPRLTASQSMSVEMDGAPRRTLRRANDFVMVTEKIGGDASGGFVKKAVIFHSKETSLSLATTNRDVVSMKSLKRSSSRGKNALKLRVGEADLPGSSSGAAGKLRGAPAAASGPSVDTGASRSGLRGLASVAEATDEAETPSASGGLGRGLGGARGGMLRGSLARRPGLASGQGGEGAAAVLASASEESSDSDAGSDSELGSDVSSLDSDMEDMLGAADVTDDLDAVLGELMEAPKEDPDVAAMDDIKEDEDSSSDKASSAGSDVGDVGEAVEYVDSDEEEDAAGKDQPAAAAAAAEAATATGRSRHSGAACSFVRSAPVPAALPGGVRVSRRWPGVMQLEGTEEHLNTRLDLRFGAAADQGRREGMEDRMMAVADMAATLGLDDDDDTTAQAYFGVYDGHSGERTSQMLMERLHLAVLERLREVDDPGRALTEAFTATDQAWVNSQVEAHEADGTYTLDGSTAVVAVVREEEIIVVDDDYVASRGDALRTGAASGAGGEEPETRRVRLLYVANAGDCRAVLCRGGWARDMSVDHKASLDRERERVEAAGGTVHNGRVNGVIAVTRAFGDPEFKVLMDKTWWGNGAKADILTATPDIRSQEITAYDEFVILACDGLWDVMTSQQAVNFVRRRLRESPDLQAATEALVAKAIELASVDNVSAIVVALNQQMSEAAPSMMRGKSR